MDALIQNAIRTSEIEDERLGFGSVRSSVARQVGVEQVGISARTPPESEAQDELLLQSTHQLDEPISREQLCLWQSMLFMQGINARKYQSLAKVSKATATRDLAELVEKGCLSKPPGGGRITRYTVLPERSGF